MMHGETLRDDDSHFVAGMQSEDIRPYDFRRHDPHADTIGSVPELFSRSRQGAHYLPESHRGFWVAASAVAYDPSPDSPRRAVYTSGNFKAKLRDDMRGPHDVADIPKVCAEMDILIRAENDGFEWIGAIVVAATIKRDRIEEVNGVPSATLHPCQDCGNTFKSNSLIDRYTAIFTTASASEVKLYQLQSQRQYQKRYERYLKGEGFQDAKLKDFIEPEWAYKKALYLREAKKAKINGSIYNGDRAKENARRDLKMKVMSRSLEF